MSFMLPSLGTLLLQSPVILVWLIGLILAVTRWQRHPKASLLLTLALIIFAGQMLFNSILGIALPQFLMQQGIPSARMGLIFAVRSLISALVTALAWVLVLMAVFSEREAEFSA